MNRSQRREFERKLKQKGISDADIQSLIAFKEKYAESEILPEGQKVMLNMSRIKSHPDYIRLTDKYKEWLRQNCENVFTVEYDEKHKEKPSLVCLKEDISDPKWLFWTGDLQIIKE